MNETECEQFIKDEIAKPTPMKAGASPSTVGAMAIALPGWSKLALAWFVARYKELAVGACLSGLELAGLTHAEVRDKALTWLQLHP